MFFQAAASLLALYFWLHIPAPGYAVGCLAVVAALMSLHKQMHLGHKAVWILIMGALLCLEFRAIDKDREENQEQQARIRMQEAQSFKAIMDQEQANLAEILKQQADSFRDTVNLLTATQRQDREQFHTLLATGLRLFDHEQKLVESLSGQLVPASDPTPPNPCSRVTGQDDVTILLGETNAALTNRFPHAILTVRGQDVISVDKNTDGSLIINMDIRGPDNKIIARLNRQGFVVNRNSELQIERPDTSTLIVEDEYGVTVLSARFINSRTFSLRGIIHSQGLTIPLEIPFIQRFCSAHNGGGEISIN